MSRVGFSCVALFLWWIAGTCPALSAQSDPRSDPQFRAAVQRYERARGTDTQAAERATALTELRQFCDARPKEGLRWMLAADFLIRANSDYAGGEPFAERGIELMPDRKEAYSLYGAALLFGDRVAEAEAMFRGAVKRFDGDANLVFSLGMACIMNQKNKEGMERVAEAIELDPDNVLFHYTFGDNDLRLHRYAEAERHLRQAATAKPPHPDAAYKLADALAHMGRAEEAEQWYQRSMKRARAPISSRHKSVLHYTQFLYDQQRYAEAAPLLNQLTQAAPGERMAWYYLARTLKKLGRKEESRQALERYRQLQVEKNREEEEYLLGLIADQLRGGTAQAGDADE